MTKRKTTEVKRRQSGRQAPLAAEALSAKAEPNWLSSAATRETIESVIIAFVLAFLFRTFEAEAFVIPTGSMAPTLMGKHKDIECPMCHYRYQANASDDQQERPVTIYNTTCPMCRYEAYVAPGNPQGEDYQSYDGDRILVAKFPYEFADPKRWDVVVFKYPGNSVQNYIKRLVGLPGETIRIRDGDLWIRGPNKDDEFRIARKPPPKILAMLQLVYDNDRSPTITDEMRWPARWTADDGDGDAKWTVGKDGTSFESRGGNAESWIRYRHRVPTREMWSDVAKAAGKGLGRVDREKLDRTQWIDLLHDHAPSEKSVPPRLISDFAAYNTSLPMSDIGNGLHWVGDVAVQFDVESRSATGDVIAELVKGGRLFQCRFDLATGKATLTISGAEADAKKFQPTADTPVKGAGRHTVIFSNVDDQLRLWVDGSLIKFGDDQGTELDTATAFDSAKLPDRVPKAEDLTPVRIGAKSAAVHVSHIKILRDVYYIAVFTKTPTPRVGPLTDFKVFADPLTDRWTIRAPDLANPKNWDRDFSHGPDGNMETVDIPLQKRDPVHPAKDQFLVLGDNSPQSQDGRLWCADDKWRGGERQYWVERELFIGKALFIYWPHGWKIPYVPLPFNPVPYFQRMHLVR
jgi:signal peptidase I